ncbi:hypothetical protein TNCV_4321511 [Trichonephila clavipes]|uniref:Uncharacterized protein n=1 Tax=Trichonephila clavipes TaxID=2585209 RepID=A0A8X6V917_TRICX|nr:hypothetical protein TNCV_4321511 [Trichonephila clavipes]
MVYPRFIPRHLAILMVTHEMFQADRHLLFHVCRGQLSGHLSCGHFPVSKNGVDDLLRKVDDMIKANRIDGVTEELEIGHERAQKIQSPDLFLEGFWKLIKGFHAEIGEVEVGGVAIYRPFGEFRRAKSYGLLYGAQGQRQAFLQPHATMNFVGLDLTTSDSGELAHADEMTLASKARNELVNPNGINAAQANVLTVGTTSK